MCVTVFFFFFFGSHFQARARGAPAVLITLISDTFFSVFRSIDEFVKLVSVLLTSRDEFQQEAARNHGNELRFSVAHELRRRAGVYSMSTVFV